MRSFQSKSAVYGGMLAAAVLISGCAPLPKIESLPEDLARSAGVVEPIRFQTVGQPIDVEDNAPDPAAFAIPQTIETALRHSPELQASLARVRAALAEAKQTRLLPNPVLSVVFRFSSIKSKPDIEAGLGADLLSLLLRPRQASAADARLRAACGQSLTILLDQIEQVQTRYLSLAAAEAELSTLQQRKDSIDRLVDIARSRVQAGEAARLDLLALSAQRAEVIAEQIEKQADAQDHRLALARLIGRPSSDLAFQPQPWTPPSVAGDERQWIAGALANHPDVAARKWELAALGDEAAVARFGFLSGSAGVAAERTDGWTLGPAADVPLPIFDIGQAARDRADANVIAARHELTQAGRQVVENVRRSAAAYRAAQQVVQTLQTDLIPLQNERRTQAETQYRNGAADISMLLLAEEDARASQLKLVQAQNKAALAYVRLERAVGGPAAMRTLNSPATAPTQTPATQP